MNFLISYDELRSIDHQTIPQMFDAKAWAQASSEKVFGENYTRGLWSGRPNILIGARHAQTGELKELVIAEVKNTDKIGYAKEGLWELSEYLHYVRNKNIGYLNNQIPIKSILYLSDIAVTESKLEQLKIRNIIFKRMIPLMRR